MKIQMTETRRGTENGFTVRLYLEGYTYEVEDHLARAFFAAGWAKPVRAKKPAKPRKKGAAKQPRKRNITKA